MGQEVYSLILAILIAVFVLEQIAGAWFYRTDEAPLAEASRTTKSVTRPNVLASRV